MKRSAQEISNTLRGIFGEQTPEGYLELLEDIADSVGSDGDVVSKSDYDKVVAERDRYQADAKDMRDRYINRFYDDYAAPNDKGFILSQTPQEDLQKQEEDLSYESLFE